MKLNELVALHRRVTGSRVLNEDTDVYASTMLEHVPALLRIAQAAEQLRAHCADPRSTLSDAKLAGDIFSALESLR
jgi:hypothetical protein